MQKKDYDNFTKNCILGGIAPCSSLCPLNLDIPHIVGNIQIGDFSAAYRKYRDQSVFPAIVSEICPQPCLKGCVRREKDDSISLHLLEKACVGFTASDMPPNFNLPKRNKKIAIVGGGLAGLTCAQKLGTKGYEVTIYEKSDKLGGRLESLLDPEIYTAEFKKQMQFARCNIELNRNIYTLDEIEFDAAFIATGKGGRDFALLGSFDKKSFSTAQNGVFIGGAILGATPVEDIGQAIIASHSIEKYIKLGKTDGIPETFLVTDSCIKKDMGIVDASCLVMPTNNEKYCKEEAILESKRCLLCDCTECKDACELFEYFQKTPRQITGEAIASLHSKASIAKQMATSIVASCNLCGLCGEVCPKNIDMGQLAYDFRYFIAQSKIYPPAFSDFYIRDMIFSNDEAGVSRPAPGHKNASYLFFPGCQLGASNPEYVIKSYAYLLERIPDTAIMLGCCGAPADWGTDKALNKKTIDKIKGNWENFDKPQIVYACSTCQRQLEKYLPEAKLVSLYELMSGHLYHKSGENYKKERMCVFDPCSSRYNEKLQRSVRQIAEASGVELDELFFSGNKARCCGWGGHISAASPVLAERIVNNRINANNNPYITYCTNCRDTFAWKGKKCVHILDIILGLNGEDYFPPSLGTRRKNKLLTKQKLLSKFYGETFDHIKEEEFYMEVKISRELIKKLNQLLILEEDVVKTIRHCESTGNSLYDSKRDCYMGHLKIGIITYWVEYRKEDGKIILINAYSHRVEILED